MKTAILSFLAFVLFSTAANAQANVASHNVSMVLSNVITLAITTGDVSISLSTVADYTNGKAATSPTTLSVSSNKSYTITAYASSTATVSGDLTGPAGDIPLTALTVKEGSNAYGPISASSGSPTTILATHAAGGSQSTNVTYFANPGFGYAAGTYATNITYTATQL